MGIFTKPWKGHSPFASARPPRRPTAGGGQRAAQDYDNRNQSRATASLVNQGIDPWGTSEADWQAMANLNMSLYDGYREDPGWENFQLANQAGVSWLDTYNWLQRVADQLMNSENNRFWADQYLEAQSQGQSLQDRYNQFLMAADSGDAAPWELLGFDNRGDLIRHCQEMLYTFDPNDESMCDSGETLFSVCAAAGFPSRLLETIAARCGWYLP